MTQIDEVSTRVDGAAVHLEGIVHALHRHHHRGGYMEWPVEYHSAPTDFVGQQRVTRIALGREGLHLPDAVQIGRGSGELLPALRAECGEQRHAQTHLRDQRDPVGPGPCEQLRGGGRRHRTIGEERRQQPSRVGGQQKQAQQQQLGGNGFQPDVVGHVEQEDLRQVHDAHQRPSRRGAGQQQEQTTEDLGQTKNHLIRR
ncbi:Uncharacterised protein [Mycobacteroides abscessus subsp. abscessus]|nr:Uncharacterised protein [Mycobacteroides abscessus subsp. abscessus]